MFRRSLALILAAALPLAASAQRPPPRVERGPIASYPFDGDAVDQVTHAPAPETATRPAEDRDGRRGGALQFDGRSHVNLGDRIEAPRFTISAWIRPDVVDRVQVIVSRVRNLPGHWQKNFELRLNTGGRLFLHAPSGAAWEGVEGTRAIAPGRWTHVAAVYDGQRAQLFVDGTRDGAPLPVVYAQTRTATFVGARPEGGGRDGRTPSGPTFHFVGAIDDVSIWDRALVESELAAVGLRTPRPPERSPFPPREPAPPVSAELLARYPLDGDARDVTGGEDGVVVGARPAEDRHGDPRGSLGFTGKEHVNLGLREEPERFTISAWIRPARVDRELVIFAKRSTARGPRDRWLELRVEPRGRIALSLPGGLRPQGLRSTAAVAPGRWVHVTAAFDGERATLFIDGRADAEATLEPFDASRGPAFVGARPDDSGKRARPGTGFEGRLDDVRLYRGALDGVEVAALVRERPEPDRRPGHDDEEEVAEALLVKVDKLLVRFDTACARRSTSALAQVETKIVEALAEAERAARGEPGGRALAQRIRRAASELEAERGRTDVISLDKKRGALFTLSEALWTELAEELDRDTTGPQRDRF
jgi:hypothetical protein